MNHRTVLLGLGVGVAGVVTFIGYSLVRLSVWFAEAIETGFEELP